MSAFNSAWTLLKNMIDMREYPEGSGRFVTLEEYHRMKNDEARQRLNAQTPQPVQAHAPHLSKPQSPNPGNVMVNSKTGVYDPNDPEGWHPMGRGA